MKNQIIPFLVATYLVAMVVTFLFGGNTLTNGTVVYNWVGAFIGSAGGGLLYVQYNQDNSIAPNLLRISLFILIGLLGYFTVVFAAG